LATRPPVTFSLRIGLPTAQTDSHKRPAPVPAFIRYTASATSTITHSTVMDLATAWLGTGLSTGFLTIAAVGSGRSFGRLSSVMFLRQCFGLGTSMIHSGTMEATIF